MADAADTSVVRIARLRIRTVPASTAPCAGSAVTSLARVGGLTRNRAATIPALTSDNHVSVYDWKQTSKKTYPQVQVSAGYPPPPPPPPPEGGGGGGVVELGGAPTKLQSCLAVAALAPATPF